jgi:hypothetical protein
MINPSIQGLDHVPSNVFPGAGEESFVEVGCAPQDIPRISSAEGLLVAIDSLS